MVRGRAAAVATARVGHVSRGADALPGWFPVVVLAFRGWQEADERAGLGDLGA